MAWRNNNGVMGMAISACFYLTIYLIMARLGRNLAAASMADGIISGESSNRHRGDGGFQRSNNQA